MNTKDNKRHQETLQHIYTAFAALLRDQEPNKVSIKNFVMWKLLGGNM